MLKDTLPKENITFQGPICEINNLVYNVQNKTLIKNLDLKLNSHKRTVIMGYNGAGKSILLRLLHGILCPTSGSILWEGKPISESVRKKQAMIFQRPVLLRRSVAANLDFVLGLRGKVSKTKRIQLLDKVGLTNHTNQPARLLSGGEQQRLALAKALALNPKVLLLDEPTANLDPSSVSLIEDNILEACENGVKIIFVTHDIGQAKRIADEIIFMNKGKIAEHSPADKFFSSPMTTTAKNYLEGLLP